MAGMPSTGCVRIRSIDSSVNQTRGFFLRTESAAIFFGASVERGNELIAEALAAYLFAQCIGTLQKRVG